MLSGSYTYTPGATASFAGTSIAIVLEASPVVVWNRGIIIVSNCIIVRIVVALDTRDSFLDSFGLFFTQANTERVDNAPDTWASSVIFRSLQSGEISEKRKD